MVEDTGQGRRIGSKFLTSARRFTHQKTRGNYLVGEDLDVYSFDFSLTLKYQLRDSATQTLRQGLSLRENDTSGTFFDDLFDDDTPSLRNNTCIFI